MLRKVLASAAGLLSVVGFLVVSPLHARKESSENKLLNAFIVDSSGNVEPVDFIQLNGKKVRIGEVLETGFVNNNNDGDLVLAISGQGLVNVTAKTTTFLELNADMIWVCRCHCGSHTDTLPPTTESECSALNGRRCEYPEGTFRTLSGCGLTWIPNTPSAEWVGDQHGSEPEP